MTTMFMVKGSVFVSNKDSKFSYGPYVSLKEATTIVQEHISDILKSLLNSQEFRYECFIEEVVFTNNSVVTLRTLLEETGFYKTAN